MKDNEFDDLALLIADVMRDGGTPFEVERRAKKYLEQAYDKGYANCQENG